MKILTEAEYRRLTDDAGRWAAFRAECAHGTGLLFDLMEQSSAYLSLESTEDDFDEAMDVAIMKLINAKTAL